MLAVYASIQHFRHFLKGRKFKIFKDQRPLTSAFMKALEPVSNRHINYHSSRSFARRSRTSPAWTTWSRKQFPGSTRTRSEATEHLCTPWPISWRMSILRNWQQTSLRIQTQRATRLWSCNISRCQGAPDGSGATPRSPGPIFSCHKVGKKGFLRRYTTLVTHREGPRWQSSPRPTSGRG